MSMRFMAKVNGGRSVVDQAIDLPEGATVTVLVDKEAGDGDLELTLEQEAELDDATAEADGAGWIPAEQVIAELRRR